MNSTSLLCSRRQWLVAIYGCLPIGTVSSATNTSAASGTNASPRVLLSDYLRAPDDDDTDALHAALAAAVGGTLVVPAVELTLRPVTVPSYVRIELAAGTVLNAKAGFKRNDRLINITDVSNVTIIGNGATVAMPKSEYREGEQRHGVFIVGSSDVQIHNLISRDTGGDGFYIGRSGKAGTHSCRVLLNNCRAINNRRQGLSIVSGEDIEVRGGIFESTGGTAPQYGIDIEPNDSDDRIRNVRLIGVRTRNNLGGGLLIALSGYASGSDVEVSVEVIDFTSEHDGLAGGGGRAGIRFAGARGAPWRHTINGDILIRNARILSPGHSGILMERWDVPHAPLVRIEDVSITNPGSSDVTAAEDRSGLLISGSDLGGADFGRVQAARVQVYDTRQPQLTYSPVYIYRREGESGIGHPSRIFLRDCIGVDLKPVSGQGNIVANSKMLDSSVEYSN